MNAGDAPTATLRMVLGVGGGTDLATEVSMATKKTTVKKAAKPAAAPKPTKAKPERPPKEDLVVFAFRLSSAERDAIHKTARPARASRFVRRVAAAFAGEDEAAFKAVVKEAREARG